MEKSEEVALQTWTVGEFRITKVLELEESMAGGVPGGILPDAAPRSFRSWIGSSPISPPETGS